MFYKPLKTYDTTNDNETKYIALNKAIEEAFKLI